MTCLFEHAGHSVWHISGVIQLKWVGGRGGGVTSRGGYGGAVFVNWDVS